jgi:hypothetical protein
LNLDQADQLKHEHFINWTHSYSVDPLHHPSCEAALAEHQDRIDSDIFEAIFEIYLNETGHHRLTFLQIVIRLARVVLYIPAGIRYVMRISQSNGQRSEEACLF